MSLSCLEMPCVVPCIFLVCGRIKPSLQTVNQFAKWLKMKEGSFLKARFKVTLDQVVKVSDEYVEVLDEFMGVMSSDLP